MRWIYPAGWVVLLLVYWVALVINGFPTEMALRVAITNYLPDALLGLAVFRLPLFVRWSDEKKGRFIATHFLVLVDFVLIAGVGWIGLVALDSVIFTGRLNLTVNFHFVAFRVLLEVFIYGTLAGVAYALQNAREVRQQAERAAKAEALRARAALEAMRSQLNPHFILNTFHALVGLVRREPAIAESALERLGDLLRYSLRIQRDGIDEVSLREECAFVENYLDLERLRLGDRLKVSVDTPPATLDCLVPTFAIQILVENAIRHAIAPRAAGGILEIRAEQNDGRLRVAVKDQGEEDVGRALSPSGSGMGLRLLQERLAALYGSGAKLTLRPVEGGTLADLDLPARGISEEEP